MDAQLVRRLRISVALGVALFAAGGLYGWFVEMPFPDWNSRIPLHGFADPGAVIWVTVIPAGVAVIAPFRATWPLALWLTCVPLLGLVVAAWTNGRGRIWTEPPAASCTAATRPGATSDP